ncbi:hypothetical protein [Caballeronia ptereochthonis]|uniref:hypothetical protein n=1 Tax=Caballeronia ptereochthonis TaxID=1777144 RepID=UPI000B1D4CDD|nr:hypothetical protein [Caballeronia ptereochthonis]
MIDAIAARKPRALFVDILFIDRRNDPAIARLAQGVCAAASSGVPVYLAADLEAGGVALRPELLNARDAHGAPCVQPVGVTFHSDERRQVEAPAVDRVVGVRGLHRRLAARAVGDRRRGRRSEHAPCHRNRPSDGRALCAPRQRRADRHA